MRRFSCSDKLRLHYFAHVCLFPNPSKTFTNYFICYKSRVVYKSLTDYLLMFSLATSDSPSPMEASVLLNVPIAPTPMIRISDSDSIEASNAIQHL